MRDVCVDAGNRLRISTLLEQNFAKITAAASCSDSFDVSRYIVCRLHLWGQDKRQL